LTALALLRSAGRRWYVVLVGLAVTVLCYSLLSHSGGAYSTQTSVLFVSPGDKGFGEINDGNLNSLIDFAAVVERKIHDGEPSDRLAENASLYGSGISKGDQVLLINSGSQWENSFGTPALAIKVVGPSAAWVSNRLDEITSRILRISQTSQIDAGVKTENMIATQLVPSTSAVGYIGSTRSTQARGLVALLAVGGGLSLAAAVGLDRLISRRSRRSFIPAAVHPRAPRPNGGTTI
jgi:hypothetical protein